MATDMRGNKNRGGSKKSASKSGKEKPGQPQRDESQAAMPAEVHPWPVPVALDEVPPQGLRRELRAGAEICARVSEFTNIIYVKDLTALFEVIPQAGGRFHVHGRVMARVGQNCVVTLEPMESQIAEQVDVTFIPAEQLPDGYNDADRLDIAALINEEEDLEPIQDGMIDLGRLAVEFLILGIDPYPRKPDATLAISPTPPDPAEHPFAGLAALKGALKDKNDE